MLGYWRQPSATEAVLEPTGWLRTGDQVRLDHEGHLFISGRLKEILVLANGEKVPPADMELAIAGDELIDQVLVIGEGRPYLAALVVLVPDAYARIAASEGLNPDPGQEGSSPRLEKLLLARIAQKLQGFPGYAEIRRLRVVQQPWSIDDDTMTPTMKLKRARILARLASEVDALYEGHS
jgi:long-chain acyl-CoA synthetase